VASRFGPDATANYYKADVLTSGEGPKDQLAAPSDTDALQDNREGGPPVPSRTRGAKSTTTGMDEVLTGAADVLRSGAPYGLMIGWTCTQHPVFHIVPTEDRQSGLDGRARHAAARDGARLALTSR
jgi:hypothetical protein